MNDLEHALLDALNELESAAAAARSGVATPSLREVLQRIDLLTGQLPAPADPDLAHYLRRRSYEKARLRLEELHADPPKPARP